MAGIPTPFWTTSFVLTASAGCTMALLALSVVAWLGLRARGWGTAAGWTALALAGQACSLRLLEADHNIALQAFIGWADLLGSWRIVFLFALGAQALIVSWGAWKYFREKPCANSWTMPRAPWVCLFVLFLFCSATIAPQVAQAFVHGGFLKKALMHLTKIVLGMTILVVGAVNLGLTAAHLPENIWARWVARWRGRNSARLPWMAALWVVVASSVLAWFPLERLPHIPDEVSYIFQAKYMAEGKLFLPMPPDAKGLDVPFTIADGQKWYSAFPGGWAAVLAIGIKLGVPWLVNPLLGGIAVLLAHALLRRLYGLDVADGAVLLLAASPWLLYISASFMAHAVSLVLALLGLLGVERVRESGSVRSAALAGLGFGGLLHVRPLEVVIVAGAAGAWWMASGWKKLRVAALGMTLLTGLAMTGLFFAYNKTLTGSPMRMPLNVWADARYGPGSNRLGFGKEIGNWGWTGLDALEGHGPIDVIMNTNQNLELTNVELFGWACGSLLFVILQPFSRRAHGDGLMWGIVLATLGVLSLYWFSGGPDFGARYWYQMIVPLAALTVRGAMDFPPKKADSAASDAAPPASGRVWAFVLLASALGTLNLIPWRAADKYYHYRGTRPDIRTLAQEYNFGRSLVLVRGLPFEDYAPAMQLNPPRFDRDAPGTIYAFDAGPDSCVRLRTYYADRPVWIIAGKTVTGTKAQVNAGPIAPGQPLPEN